MQNFVQYYSTNLSSSMPVNPTQLSINTMKIPTDEKHDSYKEIISNGKKFYCCTFKTCAKIMRYKSMILRHITTHTSEKPFICPFICCKKAFKRKDALQHHMKMHANKTSASEQNFATQGLSDNHILKESNGKELCCSLHACNKRFLSLSQLRQHESTCSEDIASQASLCKMEENNIDTIQIKKYEETSERGLIVSRNDIKNEVKLEDPDPKIEQEKEKKVRMITALWNENNKIKMKLNAYNAVIELMQKNQKQVQ